MDNIAIILLAGRRTFTFTGSLALVETLSFAKELNCNDSAFKLNSCIVNNTSVVMRSESNFIVTYR